MICGGVMSIALIPVILMLLPTTHSIPRLASAKLRPQVNFFLILNNIKIYRIIGQ
jgi:hypothetical protein